MARTIQDQDLQLWEAYASGSGPGTPGQATIVFQCLTDPGRRARAIPREATRAQAEREIASLAEAELVDLLTEARELT